MNIHKLNNYVASILLWCAAGGTSLQAADVFTRCSVNKQELKWGEPCVVSLSVYTRTWFTEGVSFPEMQNQQGVLLKKGRSYTTQEEIKGNRYSVITQEYWYYSFDKGIQSIHFENISVSTPPVGEYKGVEHLLDFPEYEITVAPIADGGWEHSVARNMRLTQQWNYPDTLRAGDVITREIHYTAEGVPAAFIVPATLPDTLTHFHTVSEQPVYTTRLQENRVMGESVQRLLYQVRDTGNVVIPDFEAIYWKQVQNRPDTLRLKGKSIYVLPSVFSDSENNEQNLEAKKTKEEKQGTGLYWIGGLIALGAIVKIGIWLGRQKKFILLCRILCCHHPYKLYDLLFLYARTYSTCISFEIWICRNRPELLQWYHSFSSNLFDRTTKKKVGIWERLKLTGILVKK